MSFSPSCPRIKRQMFVVEETRWRANVKRGSQGVITERQHNREYV